MRSCHRLFDDDVESLLLWLCLLRQRQGKDTILIFGLNLRLVNSVTYGERTLVGAEGTLFAEEFGLFCHCPQFQSGVPPKR